MSNEERQSFRDNYIQTSESSGRQVTVYRKRHKLSESQFNPLEETLRSHQDGEMV